MSRRHLCLQTYARKENGLKKNLIKVGGGSGYWGDASMATKQLLSHEDLDFIVYDYLAEITMAIMARAKEKNDSLGYATLGASTQLPVAKFFER